MAGLAIGSVSASQIASVQLGAEIDRHWRGTYDLLIRPSGAHIDVEKTNGVVEPNFLGFTGQGGISPSQLIAIRDLPLVEVAAPVATVGYMSYIPSGPYICVPRLPDRPTLFKVDITLSTGDGLRAIPLSHTSSEVFIGPVVGDSFRLWVSGLGPYSSSGAPGGGMDASLFSGYLPPIVSPLMAVDPAAERALLGPSADVLGRFDLIKNRTGLDTSNVDLSLVPAGFDVAKTDLQSGHQDRPVVPIVVSDRLYAPLKLDMSVSVMGKPLESYDGIPSESTSQAKLAVIEERAGPGITPVGTSSYDGSSGLRPYLPPAFPIVWPGMEPKKDQCLPEYDIATPTLRDVKLAARPAYGPAPTSRPDSPLTFRITPTGLVGADGDSVPAPCPGTSPQVGDEQSYRTLRTQPLAVAKDFKAADPYDQPFRFYPIGTFDLSALDLPRDPLSFVPLGAYQPPDTELVAQPSGAKIPPEPVSPTLNARGLIAVPPLAITDITAAGLLRGTAPIDAIRVRVRGLSGYDEDGRARVEQVAAQIAGMGLDVDIVAGSSPQPVEVYVPSYDTTQVPPADLGYVRQEWTTLGAAARVVSGLGSTNEILLAMALVIAFTFTFGLAAMTLATQTRDVAILATIGWSRREIGQWFVADSLVSSIPIALLAVLGWVLLGGEATALAVGLGIAASSSIAVGTATLLAHRRAGRAGAARGDTWTGLPTRGPARVSGVVGFGVRSWLARPARSIAAILGLAVGAAAFGVGGLAIADAIRRAGPTLLAAAMTATLRPHQLLLITVIAVAGLSLTAILLRLDLAERTNDMRILVSAGWQPRQIGLSLLVGRAVLALPATVASAAIAWWLADSLISVDPSAASALAGCAAASFVVWGGVVARRRRRAGEA